MEESHCPECKLNWMLFPPVKIDGEPLVRCIECKRAFLDTGARTRLKLTAAREEIARLRRSAALNDVATERTRQVNEEGWTSEHDDAHAEAELAYAAISYTQQAALFVNQPQSMTRHYQTEAPPQEWPWQIAQWKPKDVRRDLVRAAALLVAEIERIDRATMAAGGPDAG